MKKIKPYYKKTEFYFYSSFLYITSVFFKLYEPCAAMAICARYRQLNTAFF
jgi:hypothetical protein